MASEINALIETTKVEKDKQAPIIAALWAAAGTFKQLGQVMGFFLTKPVTAAGVKDKSLTENLMQLLIALRAEARIGKNFALADGIRKRLTDIGVTLEDRADGTIWRKD